MSLANIDPDKVKAAPEYEKVKGILDRLLNLQAALCSMNCIPITHRPACKTLKEDIETLKEMVL